MSAAMEALGISRHLFERAEFNDDNGILALSLQIEAERVGATS
jgi:hypothetical protein